MRADDALLDALGGLNPSPEGSDARLAQVLAAWRDDVDAEPITRVMDVDTALAIVRARSHRSLTGRIMDAVRRLIGGGR